MRLFAAICAAVGLLFGVPAWATINAASFQRTVAVCGNGSGVRSTQYTDGVCSPQVYFTGDFEDGQVNAVTSVDNGFRVRTLPNTQSACEFTVVDAGGAGPSSALDFLVVAGGATLGADTVDARAGTYFAKTGLTYSKDYSDINGAAACADVSLDKPRGALTLDYDPHAAEFEPDTEVWMGVSIYLPSDYEHEIASSSDVRQNGLLYINPNDTNKTFMVLSLWRNAGEAGDHWYLKLYTSATSLTESGVTPERIDLGGTIEDSDIGRWTDFVFRIRINPYAAGVTCNPSTGAGTGCTAVTGGRNASFTGGNGILQVWKSSGTAEPNRTMSLEVNRTSTAIGLVPSEDLSNRYQQISIRQYKYGWKKNTTNVTGPVHIGFDEFRFGAASEHSTGYDDVHPTQQAQP